MSRPQRTACRAGYSLLELSFSVTIFVVVLLSAMAMIDHDTSLSKATLSISGVETRAQQMLFDLERELANATGFPTPDAFLASNLGAGITGQMELASTLGFPPSGTMFLIR